MLCVSPSDAVQIRRNSTFNSTFPLFGSHIPGYHQLCVMFIRGGDRFEQAPSDGAYAEEQNGQLRRHLRPTLLIAGALVLLQVGTDIWNREVLDPATLRTYVALLSVPLISAALTFLPATVVATETIAVLFDAAFATVLVAFVFAPGANVSGVVSAICLKMLATAVMVPWSPKQQDRSNALTLILYATAVWIASPPAMKTHEIVAPILAAILASIGRRRIDATHRALYGRTADLEASGERLRDALTQERALLGVANTLNVLTGLRPALERLNRATAEATRSAFSTTFLVHESDDSVELASTYSTDGGLTHDLGTRFPHWSGSELFRAMTHGRTIAVDDVRQQKLVPPKLLEETGVGVIAFSPIISHGQLLGVLMAGRSTGEVAFTEREVTILSGIAATAAISINNARLYEDLTASESAYRDLFQRANDLIFVADIDGCLHFANEAALRFIDCSPTQLDQHKWTDFLPKRDAERLARRGRIGATRWADENTTFAIRAHSPAAGEMILETRARRISPPGQKPERFQCIARDVTERSRRDAETSALLARLQESQRLQDEFVANMSHELRTPLNVIIGYADLISDDLNLPINSNARSFLDRIGAASRALQRMVESILEYARLDRGRMVVIATNFSSEHLLMELQALCNDVRSTFEVKLDLTQDEPIEFMTDYDRLYSVLSNLLLNALKFTPKGAITLTLSRNGDDALFRVQDTGIGIEPNELRSVFEPFRQVDGSDTRAFGGVGLGLAIVRRNVDLLLGAIDVDSAPEKGTVFEVTIPIEMEGSQRLRASSAA